MLFLPPDAGSRANDVETWRQVFDGMKERTCIGPFGMTLVDVGPDHIVVDMPITDLARQPYGLLHGGASCLLGETCASMHACWGQDLTRVLPVGIELNASHLASAAEGTVRCTGRVLRRGGTTVVHNLEVVHLESGTLLCVLRITNLLKRVGAPAGRPD
jgi:uncharacterized protein (TIGR00369 family)